MFFNKRHPERADDEVFVINADDKTYPEIGWKTKRKGNVAYDKEGKPLGIGWDGAFPVFAKKEEVKEKSSVLLLDLEPQP